VIPTTTPIETAARLTKQYGAQALGWTKDFFSVCRSPADRKYWRAVYDTLRSSLLRQNPVQGEWWIDDSGTALYADGDVGDMGHEAYVIDKLTRTFLDALDIECNEEHAGTLREWENNIENMMKEDGAKDLRMFVLKAAKRKFESTQQLVDAYDIASGSSRLDAREYAMHYDGWKRVQRNNIETWTLTKTDLKHISDGIYDACGEDDLADEETFNIYVFETKTWFQDVPWEVLKEDDPGKLRLYGTKNNPETPSVLSYAEAHRWEPMAASQGVSAVARSGRGFMRAYEKAGSWSRLDPWWQRRRNAFVARHMAQVRLNQEKLWKPGKDGKLRPSRRCLALLMWAYRPR
jgi:hypothetical protein